jgi:pimeloyl-ACP methyl ester carboxylesterase
MARFEWRPDARTRFAANNETLEAVCYGPPPGTAPTIVMLHEGLGCVALWRDFPERLAKATGFGVFAWSRAGYGQSDPVELPRPLDYMSREALEKLPGVLEAVGFRYGILLGHSDGASIAAIYAGSIEDFRVRGLVLIAPHFFTEPSGLAAIAQAKVAYEKGDLRARLAKYHRDVDYLRIPVLAIQGADDQYGTLAQIGELEKRIYSPLDVAILPGCRHSPHLEQPDRVLAAISEYCARLDRIERSAVAIR